MNGPAASRKRRADGQGRTNFVYGALRLFALDPGRCFRDGAILFDWFCLRLGRLGHSNRSRFRRCLHRAIGGGMIRDGGIESVQAAEFDGDVLVNRAGVGLFLGDTQFREPVQDLVRFHF
jgi:hypothetical protein